LSSLDYAAAIDCLGYNDIVPRHLTALRIQNSNNWRPGVIEKKWSLPQKPDEIAFHSWAYDYIFQLTVQPKAHLDNPFRNYKITLKDSKHGYDGGVYLMTIPEGQDNCQVDLQEKGMDVRSVEMW
jgi:hypothetical protein